MSRTKKTIEKGKPNGRGNPLGICMCKTCKAGRLGREDSAIIRLKRKVRRWKSNKPAEKGAYTD